MQIYCSYFVGWGTTSLHKSVLDGVHICYLFLIPSPLAVIHAIVSVAADASIFPGGPLPSSLFGVVVIVSILFHILNYREESCAPAIVCVSSRLTLGMCVLLRLLGWH